MRSKTLILLIFLLFSVVFSRQIQVNIRHESIPTTIELYNVLGQRILSQEFTHYSRAPFLLSNRLANQIYIIRVRNGSNVFTRKILHNTKIQFTGNFANNIGGLRIIDKTHNTTEEFLPQEQTQTPQLQEISNPAVDSVTTILFINGRGNTEEDARNTFRLIREAYDNRLNSISFFPGRYEFKLVFNQTRGGLDWIEALIKIIREIDSYRVPRVKADRTQELLEEYMAPWLIEIMPPEIYLETVENNIKELSYNVRAGIEEVPAGFWETAESALNNIRNNMPKITEMTMESYAKEVSLIKRIPILDDIPNYIDAPMAEQNILATFHQIRRTVHASLNERKRVIAISHSQGSLYMNMVIDDMLSRTEGIEGRKSRHIAVLDIAPPTVKPSTGWYLINNDDHVINFLRFPLLFPDILPGNINNRWIDGVNRDEHWTKHAFWDSYFHNELLSRTVIDIEVELQSRILPFWPTGNDDDDDGKGGNGGDEGGGDDDDDNKGGGGQDEEVCMVVDGYFLVLYPRAPRVFDICKPTASFMLNNGTQSSAMKAGDFISKTALGAAAPGANGYPVFTLNFENPECSYQPDTLDATHNPARGVHTFRVSYPDQDGLSLRYNTRFTVELHPTQRRICR